MDIPGAMIYFVIPEFFFEITILNFSKQCIHNVYRNDNLLIEIITFLNSIYKNELRRQ